LGLVVEKILRRMPTSSGTTPRSAARSNASPFAGGAEPAGQHLRPVRELDLARLGDAFDRAGHRFLNRTSAPP
jgi:hypothetical protein